MKYYKRGFYLKDPVGNNAFSYEQRRQKSIYVTTFAEKSAYRIEQGSRPAFVEVEEGEEKIFPGLKDFVKGREEGKNIYIFDNHNHAFYLIFQEVSQGKIPAGLPLIHFDQHKDMRVPPVSFASMREREEEIRDFLREVVDGEEQNSFLTEEDKAFFYTNAVLNVGNFLVPLLEEKIISEVVIMDSSASLLRREELLEQHREWILDIDLDLFSEEMDYLPYGSKIESIRSFLPRARMVTVCTSPYFVSFERAKKALGDIFGEERTVVL